MAASARTVAGRLAGAVAASVKRALPTGITRLARDVYSSAPPLHDHPGGYGRFTPTGLRRLLDSQGLPPLRVKAWGNRGVVTANFDSRAARRRGRSPRNEEHLPIVVWALARPR